MKLKDISRPDTVTIDTHDDLAAAARCMELAQVGALTVVDKAGQLVGIFTKRDLVRATARAANPTGVLASAHPSFPPDTADVEVVHRTDLERLAQHGGGPCVSVFLPTYRAGPEVQQGPVRCTPGPGPSLSRCSSRPSGRRPVAQRGQGAARRA